MSQIIRQLNSHPFRLDNKRVWQLVGATYLADLLGAHTRLWEITQFGYVMTDEFFSFKLKELRMCRNLIIIIFLCKAVETLILLKPTFCSKKALKIRLR